MPAPILPYISRGKNKLHTFRSKTFNIDNGAGTTDDDVFYLPYKTVLVAAYKVYTEATDTTGAASANVKIGTTAGGTDIAASTALDAGSTAVGTGVAITLVKWTIPAASTIFIRHTGVATTEVGQYYVELIYAFVD